MDQCCQINFPQSFYLGTTKLMVFTIHLWFQETTSRIQLKNMLHKSVNPQDLETFNNIPKFKFIDISFR